MARDTSSDEFMASDSAGSSDSSSESDGPRSSARSQGGRAHQVQLRSVEDVAAQEGSVSQSHGLVGQPDEMVEPGERQPSQGKSFSRQSSQGKTSKSKDQQSRSTRSRQSIGALLTREYRDLLNDMVEDTSRHAAEPVSLLSSQIGATFWSSDEKLMLFNLLPKARPGDILSLARAMPTKSEPEIQEYISLLHSGSASAIKDSVTPFKNAPIAFEIASDCEKFLDSAADALASRLEEHENVLQRDKFGDEWLIDEATAELEEQDYQSRLSTETDKNGSQSSETIAAFRPADADPTSSSDIATLLRPAAFLQLSRVLFMNNGEHKDYNWHHIEPVTDISEAPAMHRSALNDLQALAVQFTRRLVQTCLFQAMTRIRAGDSSRSDWTPAPAVRDKDVRSAMQIIGTDRSWHHYWASAASRCGVGVYSDSNKYKDGRPGTKMGYRLTLEELRAELDPDSLDKLPSDKEPRDNIPGSRLEDLLSDGDLFTDNSGSSEEANSEQDADADTKRNNSRKRKRALSLDSLDRRDDAYLEACDQIASADEERNLYRALHRQPPPGKDPVVVSEQPQGRIWDASIGHWSATIDYHGEWEEILGFPPETAFEESHFRGARARTYKQLSRQGLSIDAHSPHPEH